MSAKSQPSILDLLKPSRVDSLTIHSPVVPSSSINLDTHFSFEHTSPNKPLSSYFFLIKLNCKEKKKSLCCEKKRVMGGNERQRKSSGLFSVFNVFKSKKSRGGYYEGYDDGMKTRRIWPSDEDNGCWGAADPNIDRKTEDFIAQYKKRVSESEHVQVNPAPAVAATATEC